MSQSFHLSPLAALAHNSGVFNRRVVVGQTAPTAPAAGKTMKRFLALICIAIAPLAVQAQAGGLTLSLDNESPLSRWGRWTSTEPSLYGFRVGVSRNMAPTAQWQEGNFVFKLSRDPYNDRNDLFFGLKILESQAQTTSLGCMSHSENRGYGKTTCGVQWDLNLR